MRAEFPQKLLPFLKRTLVGSLLLPRLARLLLKLACFAPHLIDEFLQLLGDDYLRFPCRDDQVPDKNSKGYPHDGGQRAPPNTTL